MSGGLNGVSRATPNDDVLLQHILNTKVFEPPIPWWRTSGFTAFVMYLSCLIFGAIIYTYALDDMTFIRGLYFTTATLTTVGYGDILPAGHHAKVFTIFYVFLGFRIFTYVLGAVSRYYVTKLERNERRERKAQGAKTFRSRMKLRLSGMGSSWRALGDDNNNKIAKCFFLFVDLSTVCAPFVIGVLMVSIIESQLEGTSRSEGKWALYECIYYAIVTATTVGFGDVVPQEETSQMLATIYIPYLVVSLTVAIAGVECVLVQFRMKDKMENFDVMGALASIPSLKGEISKTEFALFMLHHIGKINEDDLGEIIHHFDLLDERKVGMIRIDSSTAMAMNSAVSSSNPMSQEEQLSEVDDEALLGTTELAIVGKAEV